MHARPASTMRSILGTLVLAAVVAACGGDGGGAGGGSIVVGMRTDFGGFNSITNTDQYTDEIIKYALFTPLVQYDEDLGVQPWLAESWELDGDTAVVFALRDDVTWHDGRPVTAERRVQHPLVHRVQRHGVHQVLAIDEVRENRLARRVVEGLDPRPVDEHLRPARLRPAEGLVER